MRSVLITATAVAVVALSGCGGDVPRGRVHGKITAGGKPLTGTTVIFLAKDNKTHVADLGPDGAYEVSGVALGPVRVSVQQSLPAVSPKGQFDPPPLSSAAKGVTDEKAGQAPAPAPKAGAPRLPAHYADADKSGLTFELKSADQEWSVDLK